MVTLSHVELLSSAGAAVGPLLAGLLSAQGWDQVFYMLMTADFFALLVSLNKSLLNLLHFLKLLHCCCFLKQNFDEPTVYETTVYRVHVYRALKRIEKQLKSSLYATCTFQGAMRNRTNSCFPQVFSILFPNLFLRPACSNYLDFGRFLTQSYIDSETVVLNQGTQYLRGVIIQAISHLIQGSSLSKTVFKGPPI